MLKNQTFLAPLLPFWEKGLGDEGRISVYAFALLGQARSLCYAKFYVVLTIMQETIESEKL